MSVFISFAGKERVGNYEKKGKSQSFRMQIIHNDIHWLIYLLIMDYSLLFY